MGSPARSDEAGGRLRYEDAMPDPAPKSDEIDDANARFWKPQTLEELMAGKKPFTSWDDLDIPDLTDEERDAFAAALADE
jgi:hypothetical protein